MKKVIIDPAFWEIFPEGQVNLLVLKGIDNSVNEEKSQMFGEWLAQAKEQAKDYVIEENFSDNQVIQEWRKAFQQFKTKKGARSSIEALLKRVHQDRDFSPINPLVDMYNSMSLKYAVPAGGEDLDRIVGDLHLGKAQGGEAFFPLGADKDAPALTDELIYYDNEGAICRSLNWREAQRTMLQETTENAVLVIEAVNPQQVERAHQAMSALKNSVEDYFKVKSCSYVLTQAQTEATIL